MGLVDWTEVLHEEKCSINVELVIKVTDIPMLMMMLGVIWCRAELITLGFIGNIRLALQWLQDQFALLKGFDLLQFLLTSE